MKAISNEVIIQTTDEDCKNQLVIRKAILADIDSVEDTYNEHFIYEKEHGSFTVFKKGVYPTREDAIKAVNAGTLYVGEENNKIVGKSVSG